MLLVFLKPEFDQLTVAFVVLVGQIIPDSYVITQAHNFNSDSQLFTTCERCTHILSARDIISRRDCAHGVLLQHLAPVLRGTKFMQETGNQMFSDQFMCWALVQSQNHDNIIKIKSRGTSHTFLVIADSVTCTRLGLPQLGICNTKVSAQNIRLSCRNASCKAKKRVKQPRGSKIAESIQNSCPHLAQLCSSSIYQQVIGTDIDEKIEVPPSASHSNPNIT
jgi:hypothetical protein